MNRNETHSGTAHTFLLHNKGIHNIYNNWQKKHENIFGDYGVRISKPSNQREKNKKISVITITIWVHNTYNSVGPKRNMFGTSCCMTIFVRITPKD